tara:strand:- start:393 stop:800 length:408 start_codon:yes stop_codon:yes gene_type:complete
MAIEYLYGQFSPEHFLKIKKGVELFNEQKYWECHEELEHHWLEDAGDNARLIYWAIIQVAAAMYHYRDENLEGVHGLIYKAKDKLNRAVKNNVETKFLLEAINWHEFRQLVLSSPEKGTLDQYRRIFEFRFEGDL